MRKILEKPYVSLWLSVPVIIAVGFIWGTGEHQFQFSRQYLYLSEMNVFILLAILFEMTGIIYWILNRKHQKLIELLIFLHIIFSVGGVFLLSVYTFENLANITLFNIPASRILMEIVLAQLIFLLNLSVSYLRK